MKTIRYSLDHGIATITFDEPDSPVNTMCLQWQQDMDAVAAQVLQDKDSITGIVTLTEHRDPSASVNVTRFPASTASCSRATNCG